MISQVEINLCGLMRKPADRSRHKLELCSGMTVADALRAIGYRDEELGFFSVQVRQRPARLEQPLEGGDEIVVCLPLGGG